MIYLDLFITFFKIGLFTIGGGYAMIPLIQQEVVGHGWLTMTQLTDFIAVSESTPGSFAVNIATFVGTESGGVLGALITTTAVVLPSFIIILFIAKAFNNFQDNKWVKATLFGMRPVVIGLIASAVWLLMSNGFIQTGIEINSVGDFFGALNYQEIVIFMIGSFIYFRFKLHPIKLILISAGLGMLFFGVMPIFF